MSDKTNSAPVVDTRRWYGGDPELWWMLIPPFGVAAGWASLTVAMLGGGWAAGAAAVPSPGDLAQTCWMMLSAGHRVDEAWLLSSPATAVAPAGFLWGFIGGTLALIVAVSAVGIEWFKAGMPLGNGAGRGRGRPSRKFLYRRWPLRRPWTPQRPGPGVLLGKERGRLVVADDGLPALCVGPTGSGKTRHVLAPNVAHWPGPVVATSVKTDLADYTAHHRAKIGNVYGFDPGGSMWPWMRQTGVIPVVWDPVELLKADPTREHAKLLAQFLTSHSSAHGAGSQGIWSTLATEVLATVLLISVELGRPLTEALRWMIDAQYIISRKKFPWEKLSEEAKRSARDLKILASKDDRLFGSIEVTIREVTGALQPTAEKLSQHDDAELLPVDLTVSGRQDTLYLVAHPMTMTTYAPVFAGVIRHLFHVTESSLAGPDHLPQRPLYALDEMANLARMEDLPEVFSTIRSRAQVLAGIQEPSQLVSGWGRDRATTVLGNLPVKLQLPGSSDASALRAWADLSGDEDYDLASWRTIKSGCGRVLAGNRKPFEIVLSDPKRWIPEKPKGTGTTAAPDTSDAPDNAPDTSDAPDAPDNAPDTSGTSDAPDNAPDTSEVPKSGGGVARAVGSTTAPLRDLVGSMFAPLPGENGTDDPANNGAPAKRSRSAGEMVAGLAEWMGFTIRVEEGQEIMGSDGTRLVVLGEDPTDSTAPSPTEDPTETTAQQTLFDGFGDLELSEDSEGFCGLHPAGFVVDMSPAGPVDDRDLAYQEVP